MKWYEYAIWIAFTFVIVVIFGHDSRVREDLMGMNQRYEARSQP